MARIESPQPLIHSQLYLCSSSKYSFRYSRGLSFFFSGQSRVFNHFGSGGNTAPCHSAAPRFSENSERFSIYGGGYRRSYGSRESRIRANAPEGDSSAEESEAKTNETREVGRSSPNPISPATNPRKGERGEWPWLPSRDFSLIMCLRQLVLLCFLVSLWPGIQSWKKRVTPVRVPYSDFLSKINSDQVQEVEVDGAKIVFTLRNEVEKIQEGDRDSDSEVLRPSEVKASYEKMVMVPTGRIVYTTPRPGDTETPYEKMLVVPSTISYATIRPSDIDAPYEKMLENEVKFSARDKSGKGFWKWIAISLICIGVLSMFIPETLIDILEEDFKPINRKTVGSGRGKEPGRGDTTTFADVAGVDEAKEELEEIVEFLRNPDRYVKLGARPPRGVLLVGPPGTGKTLIAKAVAGEADVSFISCSGSEFVELFGGMGASRIRDLFRKAKRYAPSIIFIDEIDAVARSRDGGKIRYGFNDEREQTLNQLLTEMDGFDTNSSVIVLGATNRSDVLDPAIQRPGRFDRVVMVEAPDRTGREAILKVHVAKKELPLGEDVDLGAIASMTTGFTGADLANLVNEAALLAGRQNKVVVEKFDFIQAVERSIAGIEKKTSKLQQCEKAVVARHEAGHAVVGTAVANLLPGQPRVEKLSILPRSGGALGFTYIPPTHEDRYLLFIDELRGRLVTLLGGRAAEEIIYSGRVSTGALDDIRRATDMAYKAVAEYGLNQTIGPVSLATLSGGGIDDSGGVFPWGRDQGHAIDLVQREVTALLQSALDVALSVVRANPTVLEGLGAHLEDKEKVEGEELQEWLKSVVAPEELAIFIRGKQESPLPLQIGSG